MAITNTPVQIGTVAGTGSAAALTPVLASGATSGNLLILAIGGIQNSRTFTPPAGFTSIGATNSGAFSAEWWWAEVTGALIGETDFLISISSSISGYAQVIEYDSTDLDLSAIDTSNEDVSNISTIVTSQGTGSASNTTADALALAFFGADIIGNIDTGRSVAGYDEDWGGLTATSRGGGALYSTVLSSTGSQNATYTTTDTGSQMYGSIAIFASGATSILSQIMYNRQQQA